jgi:RNA-directed DNA polymerase
VGKLGATTREVSTTTVDLAGSDVVNGPQDLVGWDAIDWRHQQAQVQRLRQRICEATQAADYKQVRNLQKLMLRSRANTLVSVRQVTERNTTSNHRRRQQRPRGLLEPCARTTGTRGS